MQHSATHRNGEPAAIPAHPSFTTLLANTAVLNGEMTGTLGVEASAAGIVVGPRLGERPGAIVFMRYALERAWMASVTGMPPAAACLLAARAAGCFLNLLPQAQREPAREDPAMPLFERLAGPVPPLAQLTSCWRLLAEASGDTGSPPDLADLTAVERLWQLATPTEALLVQGGDDRLSLDPVTSKNRYLCPPWPEPEVIGFSSCTASSIAPQSLAAAEQARQDMFAAALHAPAAAVLARASDQIIAELLVHFGAEDIADAVLAASGTDATLLVTGLLAAERPRQTMTTILMSPAETGSGVPEAVQGRHFAPCTASGAAVEKGGAVDGFPPGLAMVGIAVRRDDGTPRAREVIASDCEAAIEAALARGHVVLHAIDGSKTGLAAPNLLALDLLTDRYGSRLDIVIDACQARIEPETIRRYLLRGWPVLVTGSKFFGAPGFCGAILFPRDRFRRIAGARRLPGGLDAYADVADGSLSRRCPGLLLRWAAALTQMSEFRGMPEREVCQAIDLAGGMARAAIMRHTGLLLVQSPRPKEGAWSHRPSVLTFAIRGARGLLSATALRQIYVSLAGDCTHMLPPGTGAEECAIAGQPCRIGQPVHLGDSGIGGLRVAFSAAQILRPDDMRVEIASVFDKIALVLRHRPPAAATS
jgi:hypothetical protein